LQKFFFKHFGTIILFAVFGTLIATLVTSVLIFFVGLVGLATVTRCRSYSFFSFAKPLTLVDSVAFGALISATDPIAVVALFKEIGVNQDLFALIFGESILNDAVSVILYEYARLLAHHRSCLVIRKDSAERLNISKTLLNFGSVFFGSIFLGLVIGALCAYVSPLPRLTDGRSSSGRTFGSSTRARRSPF